MTKPEENTIFFPSLLNKIKEGEKLSLMSLG
jgi:hypothetical protein